jgi:hypothetical protein
MGERRILHNEKFNYLYFSPIIIQVIKSRRWKGHVAHRETDHLEDPGIDGKLILRWIYRSGIGLG